MLGIIAIEADISDHFFDESVDFKKFIFEGDLFLRVADEGFKAITGGAARFCFGCTPQGCLGEGAADRGWAFQLEGLCLRRAFFLGMSALADQQRGGGSEVSRKRMKTKEKASREKCAIKLGHARIVGDLKLLVHQNHSARISPRSRPFDCAGICIPKRLESVGAISMT